MNLRIHTYTNKGGKQNNEDCLDYCSEEDKSIFVLADGLGGHGNGALASKLVTQTLIAELKTTPIITIDCLHYAFQKANETLVNNKEELGFTGMNTTAVVLWINGDQALWGHLGDSRLFYFSDNQLSEITNDHSVTYKKYLSGEILYQDINSDEDRSSLIGAFGIKDRCYPEFINGPQTIKKGDAFLLCSDGFWEYIYNEEILIDFLKASNPKQWAELMLLRHIKRTKPLNDNYSLLAIFVE